MTNCLTNVSRSYIISNIKIKKKNINENPVNLLSSEVEFLQRQNQQENDLEKNNEGRIKIIILNCGIRYTKRDNQ